MGRVTRWLVFVALVLPSSVHAQCTKDTECKGDRICEQGVCVSPEASPAQAHSGEAATPSGEPTQRTLLNRLLYKEPTWRDQWFVFHNDKGLWAGRDGQLQPKPLVTGPVAEILGAIPNTKEVVFTKGWTPEEKEFCTLFAVSIPDGRTRVLTRGAEDCTARVSPDGKRVAIGKRRWDLERWNRASEDDRYYLLHFAEPKGLWLLDLETGKEEQLVGETPIPREVRRRARNTTDADWAVYSVDGDILWSPDGKSLAFTRWRGEIHNFLYVVDIVGDALPRMVSQDLDARSRALDWHGTRLLFAGANDYTDEDRLYVYDTITGTTSALGLAAQSAHFSQDGTKILAGRQAPDGMRRELWTSNADGSEAKKILDGAFAPTWSVDEKRVACLYAPGNVWPAKVCITDLETGEIVTIADAGADPFWIPPHATLSVLKISGLAITVTAILLFGIVEFKRTRRRRVSPSSEG